jgi:F0F1-type ATP synthase delta subunit
MLAPSLTPELSSMKRAIAVVAVLASFSVFAQTEKPKATTADFLTPSTITAEQKKPTIEQVLGRKKPIFGNTIVVRTSFAPELENSVDSVK